VGARLVAGTRQVTILADLRVPGQIVYSRGDWAAPGRRCHGFVNEVGAALALGAALAPAQVGAIAQVEAIAQVGAIAQVEAIAPQDRAAAISTRDSRITAHGPARTKRRQ
jgi:hypothetical protein